MKRLWIFALTLVIGCNACASVATPNAGYFQIVTRNGFIDPVLRDSIAAKWWSDEAGQHERGGCITKWTVYERIKMYADPFQTLRYYVAIDSLFLIQEMHLIPTPESSPIGARIVCPEGIPVFHIHPPHTCIRGLMCAYGGSDAFQCQPSTQDRLSAMVRKHPFSVIQCGPRWFAFYFPGDIVVKRIAVTAKPEEALR